MSGRIRIVARSLQEAWAGGGEGEAPDLLVVDPGG